LSVASLQNGAVEADYLNSPENLMAKKSNPSSPQPILELVVSREDAEGKIQDRIQKGKELLNRQITVWEEMKAARNDYYKWSDYNKELIKRLFTNESLAQEYEGIFIGFGGTPTLAQEIKELRGDIES
jgi:hypothetical protein